MSHFSPLSAQIEKEKILIETDTAFFKSTDAKRIGNKLLLFQRETGGWPKNINMVSPICDADKIKISLNKSRKDDSTIDNNATTQQMTFLAHLYQKTYDIRYKESFIRGLEFLLNSQYKNGGWPQFWPIMKGYQQHITYNDNAMLNVMEILKDIKDKKYPYQNNLVDFNLHKESTEAFYKGIECILNTQIKIKGKQTVWCQQHDRKTFAPTAARTFELPSLCSQESAGIVGLLMSLPNPDKRIINAVHNAMSWFDTYKISGYEYQHSDTTQKMTRLIKSVNAQPLWARFYDLRHNEPFVCDRDGIPRHHLEEIGRERRDGYKWFCTSPAKLYALYEKWSAKYDKKNRLNINLYSPGGNVNGKFKLYNQEKIRTKNFDIIVNIGQSIQKAIEKAPLFSIRPFKIFIKKGIYNQKVIIDKPNIVLVGESRNETKIILAEANKNRKIKEYKGNPIGPGVVTLTENANNCIISGLTICNNYGSTVENTTEHQMAVYGKATHTIIINCNIISDGNDALSLWALNGNGMYYLADLKIICPGVDFLCPRGWCYATRCELIGDGKAMIWHDGRGDRNKKLVITNSYFDAKSMTLLGRYHHDSQFYLINCGFSNKILDSNIHYAYSDKVLDPCPLGIRTYYYECHRNGGHGSWMNNNLQDAYGQPAFYTVTALWTFGGEWNPEEKIRNLWKIFSYDFMHKY